MLRKKVAGVAGLPSPSDINRWNNKPQRNSPAQSSGNPSECPTSLLLNSFQNYCNCGGFAWDLNGRPEAQPHMQWCPQFQEYADWFRRGKKLPHEVTDEHVSGR